MAENFDQIVKRAYAFGPLNKEGAAVLLREFIACKGEDYCPDPVTYICLLLAAGASRPRKREKKVVQKAE